MCTDLGNPPAPNGTVLAPISGDLFRDWMKELGFPCDGQNPFQIVAMIHVGTTLQSGNVEITPNWHITMMSDDRQSKVSKNFHFKVEVGKSASHYWHYTLHRHPTHQTWHWVGDRNQLIKTHVTNEGGGGASDDFDKLQGNKSLASMQARVHGIDEKVGVKLQQKMVDVLTRWDKAGRLTQDGKGVFTG